VRTTTEESASADTYSDTLAHRIIAALALHRIVTTAQLATMFEANRRHISQELVRLHREKIVNFSEINTFNARAWFLTLAGSKLVTGWPELRDRSIRPFHNRRDVNLRLAHTLTVTRAHVAFLTDARARGHQHGHLDWLPEVTHKLPDSGGHEGLIADALAYYCIPEDEDRPRRNYRAFLEIDRATMSSERLASKLITYARFYRYRPQQPGRRKTIADQNAALAWQRSYARFPRVLFVLTNAPASGLAQRIHDLRAMATTNPLVTPMSNNADVAMGVAVLEEIEQHGPGAPVWTPLAGPPEPRKSWWDL
jgi:protein involved in plasmid replication-relaxation